MDLLISIEINDDLMVLIKGFEQEPDLGVNISIRQLMMIARLQIVTKSKILTRMTPRHHRMVKIRMIILMTRKIMTKMPPRRHMMVKI